ncbi:MAG: Long-chain-fatty-acid--CoA ligase FadD13 [Hydrocarboniphaga sp.]|uniref:long-chain-fatty-acid--CoA ligase n=1 Tax=Hydrocarboniphaga sp. TaxID=2033016 RepID=UPI00261054AC|nr:long-chain-fatty-acid--CoA ligase [Hydrocarboniphaga sp.]MDB5968381.1 Long-chain-fatty-acid--CoA ligase FadD13 [Hydrocarboniphaga sp.]
MSSAAIRTLAELPRHYAAVQPAQLAIEYRQRQLTYAQLWSESCRVAATLRREGIGKGDRLAFLGRNPDLYFLLLYGCSIVGAIFVPMNWRLAAAELAQVLDDAQPALTMVDRDFEAAVSDTGYKLCRFSIDTLTGAHDLETWFADGDLAEVPSADPEDTAVLLYTSGTTGRAKGVQLTHRGFIAPRQAELGLGRWMQWNEPQEKLFAALPLFHIGCLSATMMAFYRGAAVLLMDAADPEALLAAIAEKRPTRGLLVPTLINMMLASPRIADYELSSLRLVMYGGSPIAPQTLTQALTVFKCDFAQGYGMSEVAGTCVFLAPEDHDPAQPQHLLSIGKAGPTAELDVRSIDGEPVAQGEVGEIWVRSLGLMKGYWRRPDEDRLQIRDGWYRSGDAGYRDADGYFYLTDRYKDMIVSGAENIYPAEIERELVLHAAVQEAAVIGVPHERWGEAVHAIVVLKPGSIATAEELTAFLRTRIAGFKIPRSLEFVAALPRNAFGKVVKYQLRDPFWAGHERRIGG